MIDEKVESHYLKNDFRVESLKQTITGLASAINCLEKKEREVSWYDAIWLLEEIEPIIGLAFVSFQNYINGSIKDYSGNVVNKVNYYNNIPNLKGFPKTSIELIIGLANYSKHQNDDTLHKNTLQILESFNLDTSNEIEIENSPIFVGLGILSVNKDLFDVFKIVTDWREKLWISKNNF